jgi:hypothetical protein
MTTTPRPGVRGDLRLLTAVLLAGCVGCLDAPGKSGHAASTTPSATLDGALPISPRPTPVTPSPTVAASPPQNWAEPRSPPSMAKPVGMSGSP